MRMLRHCSAAFLGIVLVFHPTVARSITADRTCKIEASGEGCIYDLTANANGTLTVCTKAGKAGVRWRASAAQVTTAGAVSDVGSGSTTVCDGGVTRSVVSGVQYEVLVTYERPLPGTFPISAVVHIDGPFASVPSNRPLSIVELKSCVQIAETPAAVVGEESIACGALIKCRLDPATDTDSFKFMAAAGHAVDIRVTEMTDVSGCTKWALFAPNGQPVDDNAFFCEPHKATAPLIGAGNYTITVSNDASSIVDYVLSLQGISQSSQCDTPISYGNVKTGRLEVRGDSDTFSFVALTGQSVNIKVTESVAVAGCTAWVLYAPNGQRITDNTFFCEPDKTTSPLPADGTYTILTFNDAHSVVDYKVLVTKVGGP